MNVTTQANLKHTTSAAVLRMQNVRGDTRSMDAIVEEALQAWLQQAACADPDAAQEAARGYLWKSLFLPDGTLLRFDYKKQSHHAQVQGDAIVYQGRAYSPRQLLLHVTGSVRNAWRALWLRCPGDYRWHLADTRRHILRRVPGGAPSAKRAAATLYRDDLVRQDQPDLSCRTHGAGRAKAGRSGVRDRRHAGDAFGRPVPRSVVQPYHGVPPSILDGYNKPLMHTGVEYGACPLSVPF